MGVLVGSDVGNIIAADFYIEMEDAHNGGTERTVLVSAIGSTPKTFVRDVRRTTRKHEKKPWAEAFHVITSYTRAEFDPSNPDDHFRLMEMTQDYIKRAFPGHQAKIAIQRDGDSGLLHAHTLVSNISQMDATITFKRRDKATKAIIAEEAYRPAGSGLGGRMHDVFRMRHVHDEVMLEYGFNNKMMMAAKQAPGIRPHLGDEAKRDAGEYVWRDDLRDRLDESFNVPTNDFDEWTDYLASRGVVVRQRGKEGNLSYGFVDADGKERVSRAGGRNGLGSDFNRKSVEAALAAQRAAAQVAPVAPTVIQSPAKPWSAPDQSWMDDPRPEDEALPVLPVEAFSEVKPQDHAPKPPEAATEPPAAREEPTGYVSRFRGLNLKDSLRPAMRTLLEAMPDFEEYAVPVIERGERLDESKVPKGLGLKRLPSMSKHMHPELHELMMARARKIELIRESFTRAKELHEVTNSGNYTPDEDKELARVEEQQATWKRELARGVYEPVKPKIVGHTIEEATHDRQAGFGG